MESIQKPFEYGSCPETAKEAKEGKTIHASLMPFFEEGKGLNNWTNMF